MGSHSQSSQLAKLRARTDRQLISIINAGLDHGLEYARRCVSAHSNGGAADVEMLRSKSERAYGEALRLLPVVYSMNEQDRLVIDAKLTDLRALLNAVPNYPESLRRSAGA